MYECQFCTNTDMTEVLSLGSLPPVNDMRETSKSQEIINLFPLPLCHCEQCGLTQLGVTLRREIVFPRTYPYLSGMTKSLLDNFTHQAEQVNNYLNLTQNDLVIDIGSNDGSLLKNYSKSSKVLGIEPTQAADIANLNNIETLNMYFDSAACAIINNKYGKARLVTACNVFAHIAEVPKLLQNVESILTEDGVFVSESHYLLDLVKTLQFDTIYHEHLRYYTVTFLNELFNSFEFEIFRVDPISSHGGSIRVWAGRRGIHSTTKSVTDFIELERNFEITKIKTLQDFAERVIAWRNNFRGFISTTLLNGAKIGAIGAPSRASTLITYSGLNEHDIIGVGEVTGSAKIGKNMPGTKIPVISESELLKLNPTHLLILSWHIKDPIMKSLRQSGFKGKFIVPLPHPIELE